MRVLAAIWLLALPCCKRTPQPGPAYQHVERLSRCAVRVVPATPAQRAALTADLERRLAGGRIVEADLSPRGDRVERVLVDRLPAPPGFAGTAAAAVERGRSVYDSVADLFGVPSASLGFSAFQEGTNWTVTGMPDEPGTQVFVGMKSTGSIFAISVNAAAPAPPVPCDAPTLALDDPRIRRAVVGRTIDFMTQLGTREASFVVGEKDVGGVQQDVVELDPKVFGPDAYGRVILVDISHGMWTALLDPDTAAVIDIRKNFVN